MIIQNRDGSLVQEPDTSWCFEQREQSYYAQLPATLLNEQSSLIDRIISFAFDTLGARHLEMRVRDAE